MKKAITIKTMQGILICTTASMFCAFKYLMQVLPSIITEDWMLDFQISASGISMLSSIFFFFYVLMQVPAGRILNRLGAHLVLSLMMALCALTIWLLYFIPTYWMAFICRAFLGIGTSFSIGGVYLLIGHWFPLRWFAFWAGLVQVACCTGAVLSQTLISYSLHFFDWRQIHAYLGILSIFMTLAFILILRNKPKTFSSTPHTSFQAPPKQSLKKLLFQKKMILLVLYCLCAWAPVTIFASLWGVPFLCKMYALETSVAAKAVAWIWVGVSVGSPLFGLMGSMVANKKSLLFASSFLALICTMVFVTLPLPWMLNHLILFFIGISAGILPICFAMLYDFTPLTQRGEAIGFLNMAPALSGAVFQPLIGFLLFKLWDGTYINAIPYYTADNYKVALLMMPLCALFCIVITLNLDAPRRTSSQTIAT